MAGKTAHFIPNINPLLVLALVQVVGDTQTIRHIPIIAWRLADDDVPVPVTPLGEYPCSMEPDGAGEVAMLHDQGQRKFWCVGDWIKQDAIRASLTGLGFLDGPDDRGDSSLADDNTDSEEDAESAADESDQD